METARERVRSAWRSDPAGSGILVDAGATAGVTGVSTADLRSAIAEQIRAWQGDVLAIVQEQGADRRGLARGLSFGVNGLGVALMLVVFGSTGGLTGIEVGVAGGTALLAQKVLEAVFGDDAVRRLAAEASERLSRRLGSLLDADASIALTAVTALAVSESGGDELRDAAEELTRASADERRARVVSAPRAASPVPALPVAHLRGVDIAARGVSAEASESTDDALRPRGGAEEARILAAAAGQAGLMARTTLSQRTADLRVAADAAEGRIAEEVIAAARLALQRAGERYAAVGRAHRRRTGGGDRHGQVHVVQSPHRRGPRPHEPAAPHDGLPPRRHRRVLRHRGRLGRPPRLARREGASRTRRTSHRTYPEGIVLLDLPDHDSVVTEHRVRADHVTERADLLVWVTNPQKYADAVLHSRYLVPLAGHEDSVVVVLNQLDRLTHDDAAACLADLTRLVQADGLRARILGTSAHSGEGVPQIEALIARPVDRREAVRPGIFTADVRHAAAELLAALPGTTPDARALADARRSLVDALERAAGIPLVVDAVRDSSLRDGFARTGWPPTRWVRALRADPLRTLGLRPPERRRQTGVPAGSELIRSSLPTASPAVRAQVATATRTYVAAAAAALPGGAQERVNARAVAASAGIVDSVDRAIVRTVEVRSSRSWDVANVMQWLLLAVAIAGGAWLGLLALLEYLRMPTGGLRPDADDGRVRCALADPAARGGCDARPPARTRVGVRSACGRPATSRPRGRAATRRHRGSCARRAPRRGRRRAHRRSRRRGRRPSRAAR